MACLNHSTTAVKNAANPCENHMFSLSKKSNMMLFITYCLLPNEGSNLTEREQRKNQLTLK